MNADEFYEAKLRFETDAWDVFTALEAGESVVVVDARSADAYRQEHIPGALSLPHRAMTAETTAALDRSARYVTYCDGIGCNASTKGALALARLGFDVREMLGGLDWWKRDGYATEGEEPTDGRQIICGC